MPRGSAPTVTVASLPEFMRSKTVAAVVAETLDHYAANQINAGAMRTMITGAADELRGFHGLAGLEPVEHEENGDGGEDEAPWTDPGETRTEGHPDGTIPS